MCPVNTIPANCRKPENNVDLGIWICHSLGAAALFLNASKSLFWEWNTWWHKHYWIEFGRNCIHKSYPVSPLLSKPLILNRLVLWVKKMTHTYPLKFVVSASGFTSSRDIAVIAVSGRLWTAILSISFVRTTCVPLSSSDNSCEPITLLKKHLEE